MLTQSNRRFLIEGLPSTDVAVVGSANLDYVVHVRRPPAPGETVLGKRLSTYPGGKGLNQAVAAAAIVRTALVGAVGNDPAGDQLRRALNQVHVDTRFLHSVREASGVAIVHVFDGAENSITVIPGANESLTADDTTAALAVLRPRIVISQLEVPLESAIATAHWAKQNNARWILNPSPLDRLINASPTQTIRSLLRSADPLIVNAAEASALLRTPTGATFRELADELTSHALSVVVTNGALGSYVGDISELILVPADPVQVVDTTGAGDAFAGTLAGHLSAGKDLATAARLASRSAARIVATPRSDR